MKTVKLRLDDADYQRLVKERKAAGLPSVAALVLQRVGALSEDALVNSICDKAIARGKSRTEPFVIRDLFTKIEWDALSMSIRRNAGRAFYSRVSLAKDGIAAGKKSTSGHQTYSAKPSAKKAA